MANVDAASADSLKKVIIDYPLPGAVFPPEIVPPTVLWHVPSDEVDHWLIGILLPDEQRMHALSDGHRPQPVLVPKAISHNNAWVEDDYQASAKGWTPPPETWELIKQASVERDLDLTVWGLTDKGRVVSRGSVKFQTSADPVGAPIFYRDVPLMRVETKEGTVQPLAPAAIPLIKWRLRDISKPSAPAVMEHMPTCANCHSFSSDGKTLAMDVDGPTGDKGAHTVQDVAKQMVIEDHEVFSWNDFDPDPSVMSFGLFPRVSPDGRYVAATVKEEVFVQNYTDFRFLQTFYPTRGIIAIYDRETRKMTALPGADDPNYVQTNPAWTPDGQSIVFLRAAARDSYPAEERATYANDPRETQIQYDLYRIPFNDGRGGKAVPVPGASANGKSNSFPAFSPDGKWLVYVQCKNGLLMRPDSRLFILPADGGEAREMNCNTKLMNSWHSWSPNSRWLAFASKANSPFTQIFLTHVDEKGIDTPAILLPGSTADNRAANLPEFANIPVDGIARIESPAVEYRRHFDRGTELLEAGKLDEALDELNTSVELKGDYPESLITLGFILNCLGRPKEALPCFQRALALDTGRAEAHQQWGNSLFHMGLIDEAMEQYEKATQINERHAVGHSMIADILMRKGETEEALKRYEMAVKADPSRTKGYCYWARALILAGRLKDAEEKLNHCLKLNPQDDMALVLLGELLAKIGRPQEALQHLESALASNPNNASSRRVMGRILGNLGRMKEAVEQFSIACELAPKDHLLLTDMGQALTYIDKSEESIPYYRRALAAEPGHDPARNSLAWILATHTDPKIRNGKEAVRHAQLACRNTRWGDPAYMLTLATAHAEAGEFEAATETAGKALKLAECTGNGQLIQSIQHCLNLYEGKKPYASARP